MRRSLTRRTALVFGALAAVFALDTVVNAAAFVFDARRADAHLRSALRLLKDTEFEGARAALVAAESSADAAVRRVSSTSLALWVRGPLGDDRAALEALARVAADLAAAGTRFIDTSDVDDLSDVYRDAAFDLEAVEALSTAADALRIDLSVAQARLERVSDSGIGAIRHRVDAGFADLTRLAAGLERAAIFMDMVPAFMGAESPKRYLLALQSPSEARGGGGLIGVYGIVAFDDGRLELTHVGPVEELVTEQKRPVDAPGWFTRSYGSFAALEDPRLVNLSPNFPATARVTLEMYRAAVGIRLDGVIALDPLAIGELLRGTGPLRAPGWHREITRVNIRRTLLHDIYRHFDYREREQNIYLRGLVQVFMAALGSDDLHVKGMLTGLGVATQRQHLKLFAADPLVQARIGELGIAGDYREAGPNVQVVFNNNFSANKVDFFLKRTVETTISLTADGDADVKLEITLQNEASDGKTVLVRPLHPALPFGTNHMLLGLIVPRDARPGRVTAEGRTVVQLPRMDADRPLVLQAVDVAARAEERVVFRYFWPRAWDPASGRFELTLWPQAAVRPDFFGLSVRPPPGVVFDAPAGWVASDGRLETEGRLREPLRAVLQVSAS